MDNDTRMADALSSAGHGNRKPKKPREIQKVPIGPTETIRNRLQMTQADFGVALGFSSNFYSGAVKDGKIAKTAALAAEALMRRQHASGEEMDTVFILRVIKGAPTALRMGELRTLVLDNVEYFLVPKNGAKA